MGDGRVEKYLTQRYQEGDLHRNPLKLYSSYLI